MFYNEAIYQAGANQNSREYEIWCTYKKNKH